MCLSGPTGPSTLQPEDGDGVSGCPICRIDGARNTFVDAQRARKVADKDLWTALARAALNLDESIVHP